MGLAKGVLEEATVGLEPPTPMVTLEGEGFLLVPTPIVGPYCNILGELGPGGVSNLHPTPTVCGDLIAYSRGSS